ncbi:MAG: hypothetical protein HOP09_14655 [Hyphomicrobium sp.]|nr:hypothetical protein [Hyphomicrobium sp.]
MAYDLKSVICTVNGVPVDGWSEDDAITFENDSDIWTVTKTADGKALYSKNNDNALMCTLHLSQTTRAYAFLAGFIQTQAALPGFLLVPALVAIVDPSNGDSTIGTAVFMNWPEPSKAKTVGTVEIKMHLKDPTRTFGVANLL